MQIVGKNCNYCSGMTVREVAVKKFSIQVKKLKIYPIKKCIGLSVSDLQKLGYKWEYWWANDKYLPDLQSLKFKFWQRTTVQPSSLSFCAPYLFLLVQVDVELEHSGVQFGKVQAGYRK